MKIKLNVDMLKFKAGRVLNIEVDQNNIPIDQFWRNRLKDAEIDNCVEIVNKKKVK